MSKTQVALTGPLVSSLTVSVTPKKISVLPSVMMPRLSAGENGQAVIENRKGDAGGNEALVLLKTITSRREGVSVRVGVAGQVLARAAHHVEGDVSRTGAGDGDDDVLEGEGFGAAVGACGQRQYELGTGAGNRCDKGLQVVGQDGALHEHRIVEGEARSTLEGVSVAAGLVDRVRKGDCGCSAVDAVGPLERIARFEIAHRPHVDRELEAGGGAADVEDPGGTHRSAGVAIDGVRDAEEDIGVAFLDDAEGVPRENRKTVVENREGDAW